MTKKFLAVVLAVVMIVSTFAFSASALSYNPVLTTGTVKMIISADKTTVSAGDVVNFTLSIDPGANSGLGSFGVALAYNKAQLTPVGSTNTEFRTWQGDCAASYGNPSAAVNFSYAFATQCASFLNADEKAYYTGGIMIVGSSTSTANSWSPENGEAFMTFSMTVADDVSAGDEIWIGAHDAAFQKKASYVAVGKTRLGTEAYDTSDGMIKLTVASSDPVVALNKKQVKFVSDGMGGVEKDYKFRVKSVVSEADWNAFFANTNVAGETTNLVENVGIVAYKGTAGWDADTAKAVVAGTPATGYTAAETDYIQKIDGDNAYFGAIIELNSDTCDYDITFMGYVKYKDADGVSQIIFYDAEATAAVYSNYAVNVGQWISKNA